MTRQEKETQALNNVLRTMKANKDYRVAKADGRYHRRFRLVKGCVHITDPMTYDGMNQFLRGYVFGRENKFDELYNLKTNE